MEKLKSQSGESMAEAMAAMVLLAFGVIVFSTMVIQSGRLMDRGAQSMQQYYDGQNALMRRDTSTEGGLVTENSGRLRISSPLGENAFSGLTPALRRGEKNEISIRMYRQKRQSGNESGEQNDAETGSRYLFTYDVENSRLGDEQDSSSNEQDRSSNAQTGITRDSGETETDE